MAYKKYELQLTFVIDDNVEEATKSVNDMIKDILSGELQRQMLSQEGFTSAKATIKEKK